MSRETLEHAEVLMERPGARLERRTYRLDTGSSLSRYVLVEGGVERRVSLPEGRRVVESVNQEELF